MKRILTWLAIAAGFCLAVSGAQARHYGVAGCGLGSQVLGPDKMPVLGVTLNGTGMQSSGITSGTSNCVEGDHAAMINEQEEFVAFNLSTLSKEMAQGNGASLEALSAKLGCSDSVYPEFTSQLKSAYQDIFKSPGAVAVLDATKAQLLQNSVLSSSCSFIQI